MNKNIGQYVIDFFRGKLFFLKLNIKGANSLVNKKFSDEHALIAGSPAKILKNNVRWIQGNFNINMQKFEQKYINRN